MSLVYFIECAGAGAVKIGWANNVARRLLQHQCGCPYDLALLGTFPGGVALEQRIHLALTDHGIRGEWVQASAAKGFLHEANESGIEVAIQRRMYAIAKRREENTATVKSTIAWLNKAAPEINAKRKGRTDRFVERLNDPAFAANLLDRLFDNKEKPDLKVVGGRMIARGQTLIAVAA